MQGGAHPAACNPQGWGPGGPRAPTPSRCRKDCISRPQSAARKDLRWGRVPKWPFYWEEPCHPADPSSGRAWRLLDGAAQLVIGLVFFPEPDLAGGAVRRRRHGVSLSQWTFLCFELVISQTRPP